MYFSHVYKKHGPYRLVPKKGHAGGQCEERPHLGTRLYIPSDCFKGSIFFFYKKIKWEGRILQNEMLHTSTMVISKNASGSHICHRNIFRKQKLRVVFETFLFATCLPKLSRTRASWQITVGIVVGNNLLHLLHYTNQI